MKFLISYHQLVLRWNDTAHGPTILKLHRELSKSKNEISKFLLFERKIQPNLVLLSQLLESLSQLCMMKLKKFEVYGVLTVFKKFSLLKVPITFQI